MFELSKSYTMCSKVQFFILFLIFLGATCLTNVQLTAQANSKRAYFQQEVNTTMDVILDDTKHTLEGDIQIEYINNSPNTLNEIYMHLWANAYKDRNTAFARQQLKAKKRKFHYAPEEERGNFSNISFKVDGKAVKTSEHEGMADVLRLQLNSPLKPGARITIETPFLLKIPASFSRLGHVGTSYQMTQWFPKPAVYDRDGWHPMPYLNMGEFYSEFGSYDVTITLPQNYVVAATGQLRTDEEMQFLYKRMAYTNEHRNDTMRSTEFPASSPIMKTIRYTAENVHDFAWFADKRFYVEKGEVVIPNGKIVETYVYYTDVEKSLWQDALSYVDRSVKFYSEKVGNYPYPHATAVQSALSAGGGMEYPMITVIGQMNEAKALDQVITHEVGHNWFYGILGFNERDYPWLDEGINSYYDHRYMQKYYEHKDLEIPFLKSILGTVPYSEMQIALMTQIRRGQDQAPSLHAASFDNVNYFFSCYEKPALAFEFLEEYMGKEKFDGIMKSFYRQWEFKHPGPDDFIQHFKQESKEDLSWFFDGYIYSTKEVNYALQSVKRENDKIQLKIKNKGKIAPPFPITAYKDGKAVQTKWYPAIEKSANIDFPDGSYDYFVIDSSYTMLDVHLKNNFKKQSGIKPWSLGFLTGFEKPKKRQLFMLPAMAYNVHDGYMLGLNLHNLSLPMPNFKWALTSMYGFRSKKVVGMLHLQYDQNVKRKYLKQISYGLSSKQFGLRAYDQEGKRVIGDYGTIVPSVNFHFEHGDASMWSSDLTWKNTLVRLNPSKKNSFYSKLKYAVTNRSILSPSKAYIAAEYMNYTNVFDQGLSSVKLDAAFKQQIEYKKKRSIRFRLFGGYFIKPADAKTTTSNLTLAGNNNINLVHDNMADHAFESYYFSRAFQGSKGFNNQILLKEGAFKVNQASRSRLGQSDRAAFAVNIELDLPMTSMIQLYGDYGKYLSKREIAGTHQWNTMYSAGVKLSISDFLNLYIPVYNSDNIIANSYDSSLSKTKNFMNRICFTLDLNKLDFIRLYNRFKI